MSWYEPPPDISLALIEQAGPARDAAIVDVGGGASGLAAALLANEYTDITVADISAPSLQQATTALGAEAERVRWVRPDVRFRDFGRCYDLWHDRAVFHFMVSAPDRDAYLATFGRTLAPDGHAIFATSDRTDRLDVADCPLGATTPRTACHCSAPIPAR